LRFGDEFADAGQHAVDGARADEAHHPRYMDGEMGGAFFHIGKPNTVNEAGAGSVSHIASIAASFIFWFSDTV
jgi:hypothetical protein